jgi:phosphohistidine phosphatase
MKQLILFRHGKSSWDHPAIADADRPLLGKGVRKTKQVAEMLKQKGIIPDLIVSSHAVRALETAGIAAETLGLQRESIVVNERLYHASTDNIWDVVSSLPDESDIVMLFGHNPGFTEFVNNAHLGHTDGLPTSGAAGGTFLCDHWHECILHQPKNTFLVCPEKPG